MRDQPALVLRQLERLKDEYGNGAAPRKRDLLARLARRRLARADDVSRLHEILCFLRAYPDDRATLDRVEEMLAAFDARGDLRRLRSELADTGIAGTPIHFPFFWDTARWLARRWPDRLTVDWDDWERQQDLIDVLHLLLPFSESPALDMLDLTPRQWVRRLKGPDETDATFLIRRFEALRSDDFGREAQFESFDLPVRIAPGPGTPSRTRAKYGSSPVVFQAGPLSRSRPALRDELRRPPVAVRPVTPREGRRLIDLVREAMVTRSRDLYSFSHADPNDVRLVDCGDGLQFVAIGAVPERRLMFEAVYGFLTLKNGVPIGYVLASSLLESTEIAYNVFDTFRGAEAGAVFGRVMSMSSHLFGSNAFSIDPYQLGHGNREGLESGAWWFYYKFGFRPRDPAVLRLLDRELRKMHRKPGHRSSLATLDRLSSAHVYWYSGRPRAGILGALELGEIGMRISDYLSGRFGADRERGIRTCAREAAERVGLASRRGFTRGERLAWDRWSPLVMALPGVERWTRPEKRALVDVVRAKGGRRESDFVRRFDRHRKLRSAVLRLAGTR